jgi:hypothetical protein
MLQRKLGDQGGVYNKKRAIEAENRLFTLLGRRGKCWHKIFASAPLKPTVAPLEHRLRPGFLSIPAWPRRRGHTGERPRATALGALSEKLQTFSTEFRRDHGQPVTFPPGRARLATSPCLTASPLPIITMGIVCVAFLTAMAVVSVVVTMRSTSRRRARPPGPETVQACPLLRTR